MPAETNKKLDLLRKLLVQTVQVEAQAVMTVIRRTF
jgi:hypothetical protein